MFAFQSKNPKWRIAINDQRRTLWICHSIWLIRLGVPARSWYKHRQDRPNPSVSTALDTTNLYYFLSEVIRLIMWMSKYVRNTTRTNVRCILPRQIQTCIAYLLLPQAVNLLNTPLASRFKCSPEKSHDVKWTQKLQYQMQINYVQHEDFMKLYRWVKKSLKITISTQSQNNLWEEALRFVMQGISKMFIFTFSTQNCVCGRGRYFCRDCQRTVDQDAEVIRDWCQWCQCHTGSTQPQSRGHSCW